MLVVEVKVKVGDIVSWLVSAASLGYIWLLMKEERAAIPTEPVRPSVRFQGGTRRSVYTIQPVSQILTRGRECFDKSVSEGPRLVLVLHDGSTYKL